MSELPIVDCEGCGVCCLHMGFPAFNLTLQQLIDCSVQIDLDAERDVPFARDLSPVARADLDRWRLLPQPLRAEILQQMGDYVPPAGGGLDGPCTWFDQVQRRCVHHQHRPQVCRDFAVGAAGCLQWRAAKPEWIQDPSLPDPSLPDH